jgi:hypothetical protein
MSDCNNKENQQLSASNPGVYQTNTGALKVNLSATALSMFNPNFALAGMQTFNTLNNIANKMFGIEAKWFRAVPQQRSKDVIFKEYTLSNVDENPVCINVVVPGGNFPDSKYQFDLMGLEYEVPTEVQIDKKYWEEQFGLGTAPQRKDIVFLTLPNKLYQVESSFLKRGFMEQETTWVINLKKYSPEASRREPEALKETIDMYTVSEQELLGVMQEQEITKIKDDKQMSPFNSTSRDLYKILDDKLVILPNNVEMYGTIIAQGFYDMNSAEYYNAIEYKNPVGDEIYENRDRAITEWIMPQIVDTEYEILWMLEDTALTYPANYKIKIKNPSAFKIDDVFHIYRQGAMNLYARVVDDTYAPNGIYWCEIDQAVIDHLNNLKTGWNELKGYKMKVKDPIVILNGSNSTNTGFKVTINANQYIKIKYGSQEHIAIMDEPINDGQWYGVVVNIGNTWKQYNVYVWQQHPTDTSIKLQIKYYETLRFTPEQAMIDKYTVNKSPAYITNIRLFKTTIEEEKQPFELLSYFTKDADQALILDSADAKLNLAYISKQR